MSILVGEDGFEPSKAQLTDLQSAPFDQALAFSLIWWTLQESNLGRADLQSAALPTELRVHLAEAGGFEPPVQLPVRQFSKLVVSATHPSFQSSLPNRQALSLKCGCKVSHLFSSRQIYRNLFSKNLSLCSFLLIYLALSALFSTKSHHPPLSSQDHEATQTSSAARAREGLPKCAFCFITRLQNFLPEETHFLFSEQAQREAGEDERERGQLPE